MKYAILNNFCVELSTKAFEFCKVASLILSLLIIEASIIGFFTDVKITATHYLVLFLMQVSLWIYSSTYSIWLDTWKKSTRMERKETE